MEILQREASTSFVNHENQMNFIFMQDLMEDKIYFVNTNKRMYYINELS